MNNTINKEEIKSTIHEIRGKQVILDRDLSALFKIETRVLNQTIKRNLELFSESHYFQMSNEEFLDWKSQFVMSDNDRLGLRRAPYVFTKEGISILATIFKNEKIREVISIILEIFDNLNIHQIVLKSPELREKSIRAMIYEINGIQVMLDEDLSFLYQCKHGTKEINQAVKNNLDKFPKRYSWILSDDEYTNLRSKFLTSSYKNYGGRRYNPRVFTEQGVAMLATVLKSDIATKVSIAIMDTFVAMRHSLAQNKDIYQSLNNINNKLDKYDAKFIEYDKKFKEIFNNFTNKDINQLIFFEGQIYDSYSKIIDILNQAKNNLTLIDNYADKTVLDIISKININTTLITKENNLLKEIDINKYQKQYHNLKITYSNIFHDRFIIIDNNIIYHLGASLNHAGSKIFAINKIEDEEIKKALIFKIKRLI